MSLPPDAQIVRRSRKGLWISGLIVFGVAYLITDIGWAVAAEIRGNSDGAEVLIPIAGPFIRLSRVDGPLRRVPLGIFGMLQGAGLAMFIGGLVKRDYVAYWALESGRHLAVLPTVGPDGAGLQMRLW